MLSKLAQAARPMSPQPPAQPSASNMIINGRGCPSTSCTACNNKATQSSANTVRRPPPQAGSANAGAVVAAVSVHAGAAETVATSSASISPNGLTSSQRLSDRQCAAAEVDIAAAVHCRCSMRNGQSTSRQPSDAKHKTDKRDHMWGDNVVDSRNLNQKDP